MIINFISVCFFRQARLEEENVSAKQEIKDLIKQIEAEQGNMSQYTDRQAKATAQKAELEVVLVETTNQLASNWKQKLLSLCISSPAMVCLKASGSV